MACAGYYTDREMNDERNGGKNFNDDLNAHVARFQARRRSPLGDYLALMRLPNVFTAMADVAMGFLFVQSQAWQWNWRQDAAPLALLLAASSLLYVAGMTLNDVFDAELDRRQRPERPIPSGRISLVSARRFGWMLLTLGMACGAGVAFFAGHPRPAAVVVLLAACIVLYDARLKRTAFGPPAMGACRMLNVLLGMSVLAAPWQAEHWLVAGGVGVYIAGVTWFARNEAEQSRRLPLTLATLVMIAGIAMVACFPYWSDRIIFACCHPDAVSGEFLQGRWFLLIGALTFSMTWRCVWAIFTPTPGRVRLAVAQSILSIIMLDMVACFAMRGVAWAGMIFLFLFPAMYLKRWIEMT